MGLVPSLARTCKTAFPSAAGRVVRPVPRSLVTILGPVRGLHTHLPARGRARSTRMNCQMADPASRPFWETLPSLLEPRKPISQTPKALVYSLPLVPACVFQCCQHSPYNPTKLTTQLIQGEAETQPENLWISQNCFLNAVSHLRGHVASRLTAESLASGQRGYSRTWGLSEQRWGLNFASDQWGDCGQISLLKESFFICGRGTLAVSRGHSWSNRTSSGTQHLLRVGTELEIAFL